MNRKLNGRRPAAATFGWVLGFAAAGPAALADWQTVGSAGFSTNAASDIALATYNGEPYVSFWDSVTGNGFVKRYTGGSWQTVGGAAFANSPQYTSLAFYSNGDPCVAFRDNGSSYKAAVKRYTGGSWQAVGTAGFSAGSSDSITLAIHNDVPYVAYVDGGNGSKATVMTYTGGSWQTVGTVGFSAGTIAYPSLAFYNNGDPCVAYEDGGNGNKATVMCYSGGNWQVVGTAGFSASTATFLSLVFYNDEPYVAYKDGGNGDKATVRRFTGGTWQTVGSVGFSTSTAGFTSLAFCNGEPYVAYNDSPSGKVTVKRYTGGSWQNFGSATFSAGWSMYVRLAFANGEPYVAYRDGGNGNKCSVMSYPTAAPTSQANTVTSSSITTTQATVGWTRGNGSACGVFMAQASSGAPSPVDGTTYTADAAFGSGTQIGASGWYCLYNGTGTSVAVTGLSPATTYRVMVCEYNGVAGHEKYLSSTASGNPANVTTAATLPTVTTTTVSDITESTATGGGNVTGDGGANVTARGVCWSMSAAPTTADSKTTDGTGTGAFASSLSGMDHGTRYHVRAYATNSAGTGYGAEVVFITGTIPTSVPTAPTVTTAAVSDITTTVATSGGTVSADGGTGVIARGVCWSRTAYPTLADDQTTNGVGTGVFVSRLTGLHPGTKYHVRAYATNRVGTSYGGEESFTTPPDADRDGVTDADDDCPHDPSKIEPGRCGCGTPDADTDQDGTPDCDDGCADDPGKTDPGACGCGTPDTDTDRDGTPDCHDGCPLDPDRTEPGSSGCGGDPDGGPSDLEIEVTQVPSDAGSGDAGGGAGEDLTFVVAVDRTGAGPAGHVVITVTIPPGLEFVSARVLPPDTGQSVPENIRVEDGQVRIDAGDLEAGARVRVEIVFRSTTGGSAELHVVAQTTDAGGPAAVQQEVVVQVETEDHPVIATHGPVTLCGAGGAAPLLGLSLLLVAQGVLRREAGAGDRPRRPGCH